MTRPLIIETPPSARGADQRAGSPGPRVSGLRWLLLAPTAVLTLVLLPMIYGRIVFGSDYLLDFTPTVVSHVMLNCAANFLVVMAACSLKGRLDRRLATALTRVILVHGALAFFVLITHRAYSNQFMLLAITVSTVLAVAVVYCENRIVRPRLAVIGATGEQTGLLDNDHTIIHSPQQSLRGYDVILTSHRGAMTAEWAESLLHASLSGTSVRHLAEFLEEMHGIVSLEHFNLDHLTVGGLTAYSLRKRLIDIVLVLVTAPITAPLVLIGMVMVWASMGGPVIFVQSRVGLGGKPFRMFKLRTMRPAEASDAGRTTRVDDDRITPVGRWLRKVRIDELPQMVNVLKGDMSIIGPRPEWTVLSDRYEREFPAYTYRHLVRPGITGWAQVRGGYASDLDETRKKVGYDLFYIKNLSFSLDMQILLRTVGTVLTGDGAR